MLLGSVAEDVIRHSRLPVLTLKSPTLLEAADPGIETAGAPVAYQTEKQPAGGVLDDVDHKNK